MPSIGVCDVRSLNRTRRGDRGESLFRSAFMEAAEMVAFKFMSACESICALCCFLTTTMLV